MGKKLKMYIVFESYNKRILKEIINRSGVAGAVL